MIFKYHRNCHDNSRCKLQSSHWTIFLKHRNLFLFEYHKDTLNNLLITLKHWVSAPISKQKTVPKHDLLFEWNSKISIRILLETETHPSSNDVLFFNFLLFLHELCSDDHHCQVQQLNCLLGNSFIHIYMFNKEEKLVNP